MNPIHPRWAKSQRPRGEMIGGDPENPDGGLDGSEATSDDAALLCGIGILESDRLPGGSPHRSRSPSRGDRCSRGPDRERACGDHGQHGSTILTPGGGSVCLCAAVRKRRAPPMRSAPADDANFVRSADLRPPTSVFCLTSMPFPQPAPPHVEWRPPFRSRPGSDQIRPEAG